MSRLEELIEKLCPDGVEYKELGTVCEFKNGFAFKSNLFQAEGEPILRITNISNGHINDNDLVYFNLPDYKEMLDSYIVDVDDIVVAMSGATTGKIGINKTGKKLYLNQRVGKFIPDENIINKQYLYHWLLSQSKQILYASSGTGAQPNLSSEKMKQFTIPVPPLEVQDEIVKILDNFTVLTVELTEKLTAELTARKKQYEYYRDELLTFEDNVKTKVVKLCEICEIYDGTHQTPNYTDSGIKFASVENIQAPYNTTKHISVDDYNKYKIKPRIDDILMTRIGSIGVCYVIDRTEDLAYYVSLALLRPNTQVINSRYLKHYIESIKGTKELRRRTLVNAVPIKINKDDIGKISLCIPPFEEQQRIVDILDRFDKLCNDISEGLPAEIEARQKQYEYYRDKLLTFKELANNEN